MNIISKDNLLKYLCEAIEEAANLSGAAMQNSSIDDYGFDSLNSGFLMHAFEEIIAENEDLYLTDQLSCTASEFDAFVFDISNLPLIEVAEKIYNFQVKYAH